MHAVQVSRQSRNHCLAKVTTVLLIPLAMLSILSISNSKSTHCFKIMYFILQITKMRIMILILVICRMNIGSYVHNSEVLKTGAGELSVVSVRSYSCEVFIRGQRFVIHNCICYFDIMSMASVFLDRLIG